MWGSYLRPFSYFGSERRALKFQIEWATCVSSGFFRGRWDRSHSTISRFWLSRSCFCNPGTSLPNVLPLVVDPSAHHSLLSTGHPLPIDTTTFVVIGGSRIIWVTDARPSNRTALDEETTDFVSNLRPLTLSGILTNQPVPFVAMLRKATSKKRAASSGKTLRTRKNLSRVLG